MVETDPSTRRISPWWCRHSCNRCKINVGLCLTRSWERTDGMRSPTDDLEKNIADLMTQAGAEEPADEDKISATLKSRSLLFYTEIWNSIFF
uniref:Uncharacterized protein n=1 Tax=Canis lupus dingo TaxID=286419 RepID=A0A8C0LKD3_CANLU